MKSITESRGWGGGQSGAERVLPFAVALLFVFALLHSFWALSVAFQNSIMDEHSFRQTQTAYSAYWLMKGGAFFAYETPLLGYPWAIPFELPLYQWLSAKLALASGWPLEQCGRLVGRAFFYLSLWPLYSLFGFLRFPRIARWAGLSLYLLSPLYLYWSRTFLVESSALFFALAYAAAFARAMRSRCLRDWVLAAVLGALAGATKITTAYGFFVLTGIFVLAEEGRGLFRPALWRRRDFWLLLFWGFLVPGVLSLVWVRFSDAEKALNPFADFASAERLRDWNFGSWKQRISGDTWYMFFRKTIHDSIGHRTVWILSLLALPWLPRRERWIYIVASLLFLVPPMTFTNLHRAHNYYWYANGIFLLVALAALLAGLLRKAETKPRFAWVFLLFLVLIAGFELRHFHRFQLFWQGQVNDGPAYQGKKVQELTKENEVVWIIGAGWYPAVAYFTQRRSIMDPFSYGVADQRVQDAVLRTERAGFHVALLMICLESMRQPELVKLASEFVDLEPAAVGEGYICNMYRIRGLKKK